MLLTQPSKSQIHPIPGVRKKNKIWGRVCIQGLSTFSVFIDHHRRTPGSLLEENYSEDRNDKRILFCTTVPAAFLRQIHLFVDFWTCFRPCKNSFQALRRRLIGFGTQKIRKVFLDPKLEKKLFLLFLTDFDYGI